MSSTNRSLVRNEHVADYYVTPIEKIEEFILNFEQSEHIFKEKSLILDPCAGGDKEHPMSYPTAIRNIYGNDMKIGTIDIREDSLADIKADYLSYNFTIKPDIIITNPPFNKAIEIIQKALNDVEYGGYVIMLLRLNFFGSDARFAFFKTNPPKYCYIHHKRMSFTEDKKTDSIEYCHMIWQKGYQGEFTLTKVI